MVAVLWLTRLGRVQVAIYFLLLSLLAMTTGLLWSSKDGSHDPALLVYPSILAAAGLLLERRGFVRVSLAVIGCASAVVLAEIRGWTANAYRAQTSLENLADIDVVLTITAVAISLLAENLRESLTQARRQGAALRQSEAFRKRVFDASTIPIVVMDAATLRCLDCNPAAVRIYGFSFREEVLGKTPWEVSPPAQDDGAPSGEKARAYIAQAMAQGAVVFEWRHQRLDGKLWDAEVHLMSFQDGQRQLLQLTLQDVTERRRAEAEVNRLKSYLANIIDSMPSLLVGTDVSEAVTEWNRQAEKTTGIPAGDAIGKPIAALLPDFYPWIADLRGDIETRQPASREKLLLVKEGERHFYDLMMYPLVANGIEGAVLRIEEVTERVRVQELMVQTEKMMSVGGLAAGMAHEINNPLGIIGQAAQNIERRVSPALAANRTTAEALGLSMDSLQAYFVRREIPQFIQDIRDASARASKIVANMLQFSRKSETNRQTVPLAEVLERTLELAANDYDLKKRYDFRSIQIVREYDPSLPAVPMVMVEMEQVVLNLIKNAAQAMEANPVERQPKIILRLRRSGAYAAVEVEDNGPGMEEGVLRRVFEPFFTTKEPGVGTGLGLSVSYTIVTQNHKGLITVDSTPGRGARFTLLLPLASPSA